MKVSVVAILCLLVLSHPASCKVRVYHGDIENRSSSFDIIEPVLFKQVYMFIANSSNSSSSSSGCSIRASNSSSSGSSLYIRVVTNINNMCYYQTVFMHLVLV